jgi:hypothetical protein
MYKCLIENKSIRFGQKYKFGGEKFILQIYYFYYFYYFIYLNLFFVNIKNKFKLHICIHFTIGYKRTSKGLLHHNYFTNIILLLIMYIKCII